MRGFSSWRKRNAPPTPPQLPESTLDSPSDDELAAVAQNRVIWRTGEIVLGTYEIREQVGAGGMGVVHRVRHLGWNQDLAVKSPLRELWAMGAAAFLDEAEVWVNLPPHPHLCTCHYVLVLGGSPRIFAEFVDGGTVSQALRAGRLRRLDEILDVAIQLAWGLHAAHQAGVVHQDVKPANALMTADRCVKVTDFGLASAQTRAGGSAGGDGDSILATYNGMTPAYASPEQAAGQRAGRRSDVWSWAVTVLELFTGRVTWPAGPLAGQALTGYVAHGAARGRSRMPDDVAALLRECFVTDPAERPADLGELAERLVAVYQDQLGKPYPRQASGSVVSRADGLNNKALSLLDLGRTAQAVDAWDKALKADPSHAGATVNRQLARWRSGQITDVDLVVELERFRVSLPDGDARHAELSYALGAVYVEMGDGPSAAEQLTTVPDTPEVTAARQAAAALPPPYPPLSLAGHEGKTCPLSTSVDGRHAVSGGQDRTVRWWDLTTGECLRVLGGHTAKVVSVALSPDGRHAVSGGQDRTVRWWDLTTGECLRVLCGHTAKVVTVAVSADGQHALTGDSAGALHWWDLATGTCLHVLTGHKGPVTHASVTGAGAVSAGPDGTVRSWDLLTGQCTNVLLAHNGPVTALAVTETGVLTGGEDGAIKAWDLTTGECLRAVSYRDRMLGLAAVTIRALAVTPDGRYAIGADDDGDVTWWDLTTGRCLRTFSGHDEAATSLTVTPDGRTAISSGYDKTVRRWPLTTGPVAPWRYSRPRSATDLSSHEDDFRQHLAKAQHLTDRGHSAAAMTYLRQARGVPGFERHAALAYLWRRAGRAGQRTAVLGSHRTGSHTTTGQIMTEAVAITANARYALVSGGDNTVRWWDLKEGEPIHALTGHTSFIPAVAVTLDGRRGVSTGWDHTLRWWDLTSGRCRTVIEIPTDEPIFCVALTRDGRRALTGGVDRTVRHWDLPSGRCLHTLTGHTSGIGGVAITADGRHAISAEGDGTLRRWDLTSGECQDEWTGAGAVTAVAITPDGRHAVSGNTDGVVHAWNLVTGASPQPFTGHSTHIKAVAITADGRHAMSGSEDATLRWWDLETGACLHQIKTTYVASADMTPNGEHAISGTPDGSVLVWEIDWDYEFPQHAP